jgi:FecR protein
MKETRSLLNSVAVCAIAFAMVSTLAAQPVNQGSAKVARIKGLARYSTGNNVWAPLKVGDVVKPGTVIQTAAKSSVDFVLSEGVGPVVRPATSDTFSYQPTAEQNLVRMWENTLLGVDKLTFTQTGADVVTETQLDLKAGHIFGTVKKLSAASKYEVKIPNGVAGIRGSTYDITAEGVVKVLVGMAVLSYLGPNGAVLTQVIMGLQEFDARTGVLSTLPDLDRIGMGRLSRQLPAGFTPAPTPISADHSLKFVSPH